MEIKVTKDEVVSGEKVVMSDLVKSTGGVTLDSASVKKWLFETVTIKIPGWGLVALAGATLILLAIALD